MGKIDRVLFSWVLFTLLFIPVPCLADESDIFSNSLAPDALIILDLSSSMIWDPAGNDCGIPGCTRLDMAKAAIKAILDDNGDGRIDGEDEKSLRVRIGYMRFWECQPPPAFKDTDGSWTSGCNTLRSTIPNTEPPFSSPSRYSDIWSKVDAESASGYTPLESALDEARGYLDYHKSNDSAKECRQKYVILLTDGEDTLACHGTRDPLTQYKRNKATVAKAKALRDAGYKVYVIGFGANMPESLKNTLNWTAYYGGTEDPSATKNGNTGAITPSVNPCGEGSSNDPGEKSLSGYAFIATKLDELKESLKRAFRTIQESRYSFSLASVAANRISGENFIYEASFKPTNNDPFWQGFLKKYNLDADGKIGSQVWDAGSVLENTGEPSRNMKTYIGGALRDFNESIDPSYFGANTKDRNLIVAYVRGKAKLPIDEQGATVDNPDYPRKLGDIFHSNLISIATPSLFFNDPRDKNQAFDKFRKNHHRTSDDGTRIILAGANDGQIHAFETGAGKEVWSFIPPNFLHRLNDIVHTSQSTSKKHEFFLDGPISAAEVWLPNSDSDGTAKNESEWKTLMVFGLGMGVRAPGGVELWNKSSSCDDQNFKDRRQGDFQYYCGYYALDVTHTTQYPSFGWRLNPNDSDAPYLGEPWSKMVMGKVKINGNEKWVGFIGGGYTMGTPKGETKGKGFFVVDLRTGDILWSYTAARNSAMDYIPGSPAIVDRDNDGFIDTAYVGDLAGSLWKFTFCPFDSEEAKKTPKCNTNDWSAMQLFNPEGVGTPVFTTPAVAKDSGYYWIFWGTGDKTDPNPVVDKPQNRFFALRDQNPAGAYTLSNLRDITSAPFDPASSGWYINLTGKESVLSDATVYKGIVFFASYTPPPTGTVSCGAAGTGALYGIAMMPVVIQGRNYDPGMGVFSEAGQRRIDLGPGIPSAPIISQKPLEGTGMGSSTPDVFVAVSGGAGKETEVTQIQDASRALAGSGPSTYIIHWKDRRVQPY